MSELPPPDESGNAAVTGQEALTPQAIEAILADFRSWLEQVAPKGQGDSTTDDAERAPSSFLLNPSGEPLDLHMLLGQFVALRHEVNLQTKASRAQQEQNAEALSRFGEALETLETARKAPVQAAAGDEHVRPLLKTLVDLYDNLSLARREVQRVQDVLGPVVDQLAESASGEFPEEAPPPGANAPRAVEAPPRSLLARWFGARPLQGAPGQSLYQEVQALRQELSGLRARQQQTRELVERVRLLVTSLITGYTMSLQRVERALQQSGLEAIGTAALPFDPETMEVLEAVYETGRTSTEVIEEVRRGYLWRGHVFRFAQVRVARPQPS
jgi:molecular chaperone GrpE